MRLPAVAVAAALALTLAGAAPGGSPAQGWIVYADFVAPGEYIHLFRVRPDGSGRVRLTSGRDYYQHPQWSPDGRKILATGGPGLVIVSRGGRILRRIRVAGETNEPSWSPDGTRIAYLVMRCHDPLGHTDPGCADLRVMHADGSHRRRLSAAGVDASQGPFSLYSWSPDGRSVAYTGEGGLTVVDVRTGRTRLLGRRSNLIVRHPAWSPDGRWILFAKQRGPSKSSDLVVVGQDGSGLRRLPRTRDAFEPRWSPDGRRIAYLVNLDPFRATGWGVAVVRADGSGKVRVGTAGDYQTLVWSPDSSRVLFIGSRDEFEIARADRRRAPTRIPGGDQPDWGS